MQSIQEKPDFTAHQIDIMRKWADLKSVYSVAEALDIKEQTIQTHLRRLRLKLGVHRTVDVYLYLLQEGHL